MRSPSEGSVCPMWVRFSAARAVQSQTCAGWLANNRVSLFIPPNISHLDALELVRRCGNVPIAMVGAHVLGHVGPKGGNAFGPIGDWFDRIAKQYDGTEWWVTEAGLHIEKTDFAPPILASSVVELGHFDQLAGRLTNELWHTDLPKRNTHLSDEALAAVASQLDAAGLKLPDVLQNAPRKKWPN